MEEGKGNEYMRWVRNNPNGAVEARICGAKDKLEQLIRECRMGPSHALVAKVLRQEESSDNECPDSFTIQE